MKTDIQSNIAFMLLILVAFCQKSLFQYIPVIISKIPIISPLSELFFPFIYIILVLLAYNPTRFKWLKSGDLLLIITIFIAIFITFILYPNNIRYIVSAFKEDLSLCIPFFLLGICFVADEKTLNTLAIGSGIAIIVNALYVIYYQSTGRQVSTDSMYWSYILLPNTMIVFNYALNSRKILAWLCFIIGLIYAFAMGTRGPIIILVVYILAAFWIHSKKSKIYKTVLFLIFGGAAYFFYSSQLYNGLLLIFKNFMVSNNLSTRIIDYLLSNEMVSYLSGRDEIYSVLIKKLLERPFFGYGIYGEWQFGFYSAHNMYLEVLLHFGIFIGIAILITLMIIFIYCLKISETKISREWIMLWGCFIFVQGMFGGSYLSFSVFFLLGFCLKEIRIFKSKKTQLLNRFDLNIFAK